MCLEYLNNNIFCPLAKTPYICRQKEEVKGTERFSFLFSI